MPMMVLGSGCLFDLSAEFVEVVVNGEAGDSERGSRCLGCLLYEEETTAVKLRSRFAGT